MILMSWTTDFYQLRFNTIFIIQIFQKNASVMVTQNQCIPLSATNPMSI